MSPNRRTRRRLSWLLLLAILYAALAPSLGLAGEREAGTRTIWMQICGAASHELIAVAIQGSGDAENSADDASLGHGHCLLCGAQATLDGTCLPNFAPPATAGVRPLIIGSCAPRDGPTWSPSLARAPPFPA